MLDTNKRYETDSRKPLSTETVKSTTGTLESIDHIKGSNGFTSFQVRTQYSAGKYGPTV